MQGDTFWCGDQLLMFHYEFIIGDKPTPPSPTTPDAETRMRRLVAKADMDLDQCAELAHTVDTVDKKVGRWGTRTKRLCGRVEEVEESGDEGAAQTLLQDTKQLRGA